MNLKILIGVIVAALLLAWYGYYYSSRPAPTETGTQAAELESIESELRAVDLEGLDKELADIEKELQ